ncbi:MAG: DUF3108 domain-containing protein [Candidatus Marinimicrobia bacterium]|nr:DUF3108 domain-containing protein [Candidatus Neomarinimicrobiota bacterium]MCF7829243.1 DUF3108 domain-containing protein [Candidatus Neomarinimicrobiota bacterium]MCF7881104.1 DUF3108 domain-containing protein [Candidatus Neomarinimicrobiota bacterium]
MRKNVFISCLFVLLVLGLFSRAAGQEFHTGEKLTFALNYGFINAGTSTMEVAGLDTVHGQTTYRLESRTKSNNFVDAFYKVRDQLTSWIDTSTFATIQFEKSLNEGSYNKDYSVWFDYDKMMAYSSEDTLAIETYMQDVLSLFYYIRSLELSVGDTIRMSSYDNDKVSPFLLGVKRTESVRVPAGDFDCYVVEPFVESDFLFKYEGKLQIWLSREKGHIPVLMRSKATIGSMILKLEKYKPGNGD